MKSVFRFCACLFLFTVGAASAGAADLTIEGWQHTVAGSFGGTMLEPAETQIISPTMALLIKQTNGNTDFSNAAKNAIAVRDPLAHTITNNSSQAQAIFVPWRTALFGDPNWISYVAAQEQATGRRITTNEWTAFLNAAQNNQILGLVKDAKPICFPYNVPYNPCGKEIPLGYRVAGSLPLDPANSKEQSALVAGFAFGTVPASPGVAAVPGDKFPSPLGQYIPGSLDRYQEWECKEDGTWQQTKDTGACFKDGKCGPVNGTSIHELPDPAAWQNKDLMCNGVTPQVSPESREWWGTYWAYRPESLPTAPPYGTGGWSWTCPAGQSGGSSEACHANYDGAPMDGVCGRVNAKEMEGKPNKDDLCWIGTPLNINNATLNYASWTAGPCGMWQWYCQGVNGGKKTPSYCWTRLPGSNFGSCGEYDVNYAKNGLITLETENGLPGSAQRCRAGMQLMGAITGNGTPASPWAWKCQDIACPSLYFKCTNTWTKSGICGTSNNTGAQTEPNVYMCDQGRWYNNLQGSVKNATVWHEDTQKWTWACLGNDQSTGASRNVECQSPKCQGCSGDVTEDVVLPMTGTYGACNFGKTDATVRATFTRQASSAGRSVTVNFSPSGNGSITVPSSKAEGYCTPCFKRLKSVSSVSATLGACNNTAVNASSTTLGP